MLSIFSHLCKVGFSQVWLEVNLDHIKSCFWDYDLISTWTLDWIWILDQDLTWSLTIPLIQIIIKDPNPELDSLCFTRIITAETRTELLSVTTTPAWRVSWRTTWRGCPATTGTRWWEGAWRGRRQTIAHSTPGMDAKYFWDVLSSIFVCSSPTAYGYSKIGEHRLRQGTHSTNQSRMAEHQILAGRINTIEKWKWNENLWMMLVKVVMMKVMLRVVTRCDDWIMLFWGFALTLVIVESPSRLKVLKFKRKLFIL